MIRKKKGSTLVTTIITFGVILTVGTAILSMSMGDYKMRLSQNKRIMNLYGADSGLDVAYDILVKDFDSAAQFGAFKAKQLAVYGDNNSIGPNSVSPYKVPYRKCQDELKNLLEESTAGMSDAELKQRQENINYKFDEMDKLKNKEFKRSFKLFLYVKDSSSLNESYIPNQLESSLENGGTGDKKNTRYYLDGIKKVTTQSNTEELPSLTEEITSDYFFNTASVSLVSNEGNSEPQIEVEIPTYPDIETADYANSDYDEYNKNYEIRMNSTFITAKGNTNANGQDKRTVQAIYNLKIPEYKDVVFGESQIQEHSVYQGKGLTIGGNMEVGNSSDSKFNLTVNGNIFVQGSTEGTDLQSKYKGGISLNNLNNVNFNGNVVTRKTFNMGKYVGDASISQNLYAGNVYAGDKDNLSNSGDNCTLNVSKDMILDNDLTLKATNTSIITNNFYGINDKRIEESTTGDTDKIKNSSSIIVNNYTDNDQKPSVEIGNEALIMGVAYINTGSDQGYATGESVGVKGNYSAYSEHVDSDNNNDNNLGFDNDSDHDAQSPLYLVNGTVVQKDTHFYDYWNGKSGLLDGGVHFDNPNNVYSTGAIVYKENGSKVVKAKGTMEAVKSKATLKQEEYASRIYNMDMDTDISKISNDVGATLQSLYNNPSGIKTVDSLMDFTSDRFNNGAIKIGDLNYDFGLFNPRTDKEIIIQEDSSKTQPVIDESGEAKIVIYTPSDRTLNLFIATAGDVTINGKVTIDGNIIAKGKLTISGAGDKTITYDKDLAANLQAIDPDIFKQVFGSSDVSSEIKAGDKTEISVQYDLPKYLKNLLWTLVK